MPRLRQITCQIEWPETGLKFEEYGTVYGDGLVETFIAVPSTPQPFCIHLTSKGYIAEGLAMLVYIDGEYQCNRNRLHLKPLKKDQPRDQTEVDFRLRQKEKTIGGGTFLGRDWRFDCHNIVPNGQFPQDFDPTHFDQLGTIEVIVLRCRGKVGDDSGSESLTHESILGEIGNFGQPLEESAAPVENPGTRQPTVADAPEEAEELAGLAGFPFDGAIDGANHFGSDGAADLPCSSGLDGEASPAGYWTYHPQPPPRNGHRPENRPGRRVHFDYGSPSESYYSPRGPPQQRHGPPRGGYHGEPAGNGPSNWQKRAPTGYEAHSDWHAPQPASVYQTKTSGNWATPYDPRRDASQVYSDLNPNDYSDYDDPQSYVPPLNPHPAPAPPWTAPSYPGTNKGGPGHPRWIPAHPVSAGYPVFTPQPQFPPGAGYPTPVGYPPWYPPPYGFQGPGYSMNYPVPVGGWHGNQWSRPSGSLGHAKEQSTRLNESENQAGNNAWGAPINNGNTNGEAGNNNATAGGWGDSEDNNNSQPAGDNTANNWDQHPQEDQQNQTGENNGGWDNNADNPNDNQQEQTHQGWGDNNQNNDQQTQHNGGGWSNENTHNNQAPGNWDNNGQSLQAQGNWVNDAAHDNTTTQLQQPAQDWISQPAPPPPSRTTRPLYGPYGAYYSTHPHTTTALSPTAEAEEEPPYDVPETIAAERGTTHQVQPGKGYLYIHRRASPEYVDGIEEPYARFVFKYRTKEQIEHQLGIVIECEPTGDAEKRKFTDKTQDELIELLIRAQNALGGKIPSPPPALPPPPAPAAEEDGKQNKAFTPVPIPAPTAYKYLKYELPKGRNMGLGISSGDGGGGKGAPQAPTQQQQPSVQHNSGGGEWQMSSSGPPGGWVAPPGQQQQGQQRVPNWQTAVESGACNPGGGNSNWQNNNANATNQSSPAEGGWGPAWDAGVGEAGGGLREAPAASGGW